MRHQAREMADQFGASRVIDDVYRAAGLPPGNLKSCFARNVSICGQYLAESLRD